MEDCEVITFYYDGRKLEVFRYEGKAWFIARSLGYALGIGNIRSLIHRVVPASEIMYVSKVHRGDDSRMFVEPLVANCDKNGKLVSNCDKSGKMTNPLAVSEAGIELALIRARGVRAQAFREWVVTRMPDILNEAISSEGVLVQPIRNARRLRARNSAVLRRADGSEVEVPANDWGYDVLMEILRSEWGKS